MKRVSLPVRHQLLSLLLLLRVSSAAQALVSSVEDVLRLPHLAISGFSGGCLLSIERWQNVKEGGGEGSWLSADDPAGGRCDGASVLQHRDVITLGGSGSEPTN
jgi:hypothetical protein